MLLVLASNRDDAAAGLVERWRKAGDQAALVTCADVARPGWSLGDNASRAVIAGRVVATNRITAVITRLAVVDEDEVSFLHADDRAYGAVEMQAFLLAWLSALKCPVLNRPSATRLDGPDWSRPHWAQRARQAGLPARLVRLRAQLGQKAEPADEPEGLRTAEVVGKHCFGDADEKSRSAAIQLAERAGVDFLRVRFEHQARGLDRFFDASPVINVNDPGIAHAVREMCRS